MRMIWLGNGSLKNVPSDPRTAPTPVVILVLRFSLENPSPNYQTFKPFSPPPKKSLFPKLDKFHQKYQRLPFPYKDIPCKNIACSHAIFPSWTLFSEMPFLIQILSRHLPLIQKLCHFVEMHKSTSWTFHSIGPTSFEQYLRYFLCNALFMPNCDFQSNP